MNKTAMKKLFAVALALCAAQSLAAHTEVAKAPRLPFMRGMGFDGYYDELQGAAPPVADPADIKLKAATDKANPIDYVEGETIRFDFRLDGVGECALPAELTPAYVVWERTADDGVSAKGTNTISATQGFSITTSLATNGFVHIEAYLAGSDRKKFTYTDSSGKSASIAFTGGAGVATEKMRLTTAEPADFQRFWRDAKAKLAAVPMDGAELVEVFPKSSATNTYRYYAAKIPCFGPHPTTGWLTVPKNAQPGTLKAKATFDGYSVAIAQPSLPTDKPGADTMLFHVNAHGYDMVGRDAQYYTDFTTEVNGPYHPVFPGSSRPYSHGLAPQDYDNPTNAYFYYMALRVVRAFDYLKSRPEWNGADLIAEGGSQGGLQTMWAGSLVDGISKIRPYITWGCDIGNYLNATGLLLSNTWGMPNVAGAYYFDAALHAKRVPRTCVAEITRIGMGDYTCPPRGVLLSYYNMKCAASAKLVQGSDHSDSSVPPQPNQVFTISKEVEVEPPQVSASDAPGFDYTNRVVTVSNVADGSSLTLTATAPDGSAVSATATVDANGQAVFDIATVPGTPYSYVVTSDGGMIASGGFLAGGWDAGGSLFSAAPDGAGGSTERNGVWTAAPSGTNAEHYVVGCAADFALSQDASAATADRLVCVDASVQYGFFDKADGLPDGRIGACIGAMTAAESDGEAVWMVGTDDGWKALFGGPAPELDTPYVLRMEADFRNATPKVRCSVSNDGGASFAVLSDALGNTWHAASRTSLAGVALDGSGLVGSIGGTLANADVAQADGVGYASLADAIAASTNSLALLTNATWPQGAPIGTIALDCAGHALAGVSPDGSGRVVVESGYSAIPGEGRVSISLTQAAQLGVATEGRTPAQIASALAADGANGIPLWKSYALGLNPADATARPRAAIAVNGETVELGLVGIAVNAGSGATVTYRVRRFSDLADIDEQLVGGAFAAGEKAEIPKADGEDRMFYRLAVDVRGY